MLGDRCDVEGTCGWGSWKFGGAGVPPLLPTSSPENMFRNGPDDALHIPETRGKGHSQRLIYRAQSSNDSYREQKVFAEQETRGFFVACETCEADIKAKANSPALPSTCRDILPSLRRVGARPAHLASTETRHTPKPRQLPGAALLRICVRRTALARTPG